MYPSTYGMHKGKCEKKNTQVTATKSDGTTEASSLNWASGLDLCRQVDIPAGYRQGGSSVPAAIRLDVLAENLGQARQAAN